MKIAYIHNNKKIWTGAHYINDLIASKIQDSGFNVKSFYPQFSLTDAPVHFKWINNILFFFSLLEKRNKILKCDIIQGTTYTPIAFMQFSKPVISHFWSTTLGFLQSTPTTNRLEWRKSDIYYELFKKWIISEINIKTRRPLHDIATIEHYSAEKADHIIATSEIVKNNLVKVGIDAQKITVIHNAIEDYRFEEKEKEFISEPNIVFLGRIWEDPFTLKLKWFDRLVCLYKKFPNIKKLSIIMSRNKKLISWFQNTIPNHQVEANITKTKIPSLIKYSWWIMVLTSRYEWFSLSLIEGMSQWLIPIAFSVGVVPEIIYNWENWFVVSNLEEAEDKINELLKNSSLRKSMSKNAKLTAQKFSSDKIIPKFIALYKKVINKTNAKQSIV